MRRLKRPSAITVLICFAVLCSCSYSPSPVSDDRISPEKAYNMALSYLEDGRQLDAEALIDKCVEIYPQDQPLLFLKAALLRSRFMIEESFPLFLAVAKMTPYTVSGQCAIHMLYLDSGKEIDRHFIALQNLVKSYPNDNIVRWMLAVQCRSLNQNEEGVKHYAAILKKWNPGPVLIYQTYANLLDELRRHEEALVLREKAVSLESKGWSFQGLGLTLYKLNRFEEAGEADRKAVEAAPNNASYWFDWGLALFRQGKFEEAIARCEKAIEINPNEHKAWNLWGCSLESMNKTSAAIEKYQTALKIKPDYSIAQENLTRLMQKRK